jgi:hypothetical protein
MLLPLLLAGGALALMFKGGSKPASPSAATAAAVTQVPPTGGGVSLHEDAKGAGVPPTSSPSLEGSLEALASAAQASAVNAFLHQSPTAVTPSAPVPPPPVERTGEDYAVRKSLRMGVALPPLALRYEEK